MLGRAVIADEWQHKGWGKALLTQLISSARQNGVRQLHSLELADNTMMRELANEVGMSASPDPRDANQVVYSWCCEDIPSTLRRLSRTEFLFS